MFARLIEARRHAKALRDIDELCKAPRLMGMSDPERDERRRQARHQDAFVYTLMAVCIAVFTFALLDPVFDTVRIAADVAMQMLAKIG